MTKTIIVCNTQGCEREKAREGKCLHHHIEELNEQSELMKKALSQITMINFDKDTKTTIQQEITDYLQHLKEEMEKLKGE